MSFYEHIVTVGTGQGSLLFYDIRAQRFLENSLSPAGGYRKCPGDSLLKLSTGKGWLVLFIFDIYCFTRLTRSFCTLVDFQIKNVSCIIFCYLSGMLSFLSFLHVDQH